MSFQCERLSIADILLIEPSVYSDERGWFAETYKLSALSALGIQSQFVQDNHSKSVYAVLRGLHYQRPPKAQAKLVRVLAGEIFDVAVDIRVGSPTYGQCAGITLSANGKMLYIPAGFAHGFCVLTPTAEVLYKVSEEYSPEHEAGIAWNDPDIAVLWPIPHPILSGKDRGYPRLKEADTGFVFNPEKG